MSEETEYCYVLWESGYLEEFEDEGDAQHEVMACESRGMKGHVIFRDLDEAVEAMCDRLKIHIINEDMAAHQAPQVRRMAEVFPYAWSCSMLMGQTALLLARRKEDELEFAILIVKDQIVEVKGVSLQALPDTLQRLLSPEGIRRGVLEKVADMIEECFKHEEGGSRVPTFSNEAHLHKGWRDRLSQNLLELDPEIRMALGRK